MWDPLKSDLFEHYPGIALDLRGHGASPWDKAHRYDSQSYASDVVNLIDDLNLKNIAIIGHSLGVEVAAQVCAARPHHLGQLVMIDGGPAISPAAGQVLRAQLSRMPSTFPSPAALLEILVHRHPFADASVLHNYAMSALTLDSDGTYHLRADPAVLLEHAYLSAERALLMLQQLPHQKLLVRGEASSVLTKQLARQLTSTLQIHQFVEIPKSGHFVPLDNPRALSEAIRSFLKEA